MGGRLTLDHSMLTNMAIYWLALCKVPKTIINKIRMMTMAFIWSGEVKQSKFHLVRWENIACPMEMGGWGLKNMQHFSLALRAKILWLVLCGNNLWSQTIKVKYLQYLSTVQWGSQIYQAWRHISNIWSGLLGVFNIFSS